MSRAVLRTAVETLPSRIRDDVMSYAAFVEDVVPTMAAEINIELKADQRDRVVFLAGIMHLRDLVGAQLELADLATGDELAANAGVRGVRVGGADIRPGGEYVRDLRSLRRELTQLLDRAGIPPLAHRLSDVIGYVAAR